MNFENFMSIFNKLEGVRVIQSKDGPYFVYYEVLDSKVHKEIESIIDFLRKTYNYDVSLKEYETNFYNLTISGSKTKDILKILFDGLYLITLSQEYENKKNYQELGIPDLSLVTIHQMVDELKKRRNLVFSFVWTENNDRDNISIEGSGNPTQLVGLLARGMHMAIEWADKNMKFFKNK